MTSDNPPAEQIEFARSCITKANNGDPHAAKEAVAQAVVGLCDVLDGRLPDPERCEYLVYLRTALEQILQGAPISKALGTWTAGRPHTTPPDRGAYIFIGVGLIYDRYGKKGAVKRRRVLRAQEDFSQQFAIGLEIVRKEWEAHGGLKGWRVAMRE